MSAAGEQHEHRDRRRDDRRAPLARLTADRGRCRRTTALRGAALRRRGTVVEAGSRAALRRRPAAVAVARRGSAERRRRALRRRLPGVSLLVRGLVGRLVRRLGAGWGGVRPGRRADGRERSRPGPAVRRTAADPAGAERRGRGERADGGRPSGAGSGGVAGVNSSAGAGAVRLGGRAGADARRSRRGRHVRARRAVLGGEGGRAEGDGVLGVRVDEGGPVERRGDHLCDQRDPGGAPDQQHGAEVGGLHLRRAQRAGERADRRLDLRPDHVFELAAGEPDVEVPVRQEHRDGRLGVDRQRLLGRDAVLPQPGQGDAGLRVAQVELAERAAGAEVDVGEDGVVEVDAAEPFDALGAAEDVDADGRALAQHGGVEGAAAEVVDGHRVAVAEVPGRGVVGGGRLRLGDHPRLRDARELRDLLEQLAPVGPPVGRVGEDDVRRRGALGLGDLRDGVLEQRGEQRR